MEIYLPSVGALFVKKDAAAWRECVRSELDVLKRKKENSVSIPRFRDETSAVKPTEEIRTNKRDVS